MRTRLLVSTLAAGVLSAGPTTAHHSFAATYLQDTTVQIEGTLLQFQFRNPHSFVHVSAPDEAGRTQRWAVEWGGAGQLGTQGVTNATLQPGDEVIIVGHPGRKAEDHRLHMVSLRRKSDGFGWGQAPGEVFD